MENHDLELGPVGMIQETVQSLLDCVKGEDNYTCGVCPSIYMAPSILRDLSPSSFNPRVVSIGPLHREDENVQAFEKRKASYLIDLIRCINSPEEETLTLCLEKALASMEQIRACYVWTKTYDDAEVAKMMVMDGCFILEFMLKMWESDKKSQSGKALMFQNIACDLLLLENQIPYFILDEIFQYTILKFKPGASLIELIHPLINYHNLFEADIKTDNISTHTTHHILNLLHQCYTPHYPIESGFLNSTIHSSVDLDRAGVSFKPNQNSTSTWLMGMEVKLHVFPCFFWSWVKPTLRMPVLRIHDYSEFVLRNLIAYEQLSQTRNYITSYVIAMDLLVNTQEDVAKLVESKVLINSVGSNEEAANLINSLCKEVAFVDFFYYEQWKTLNKYYNGYWPKNLAWLRRTYFSNPWNVIALLAGIILFALTVVQTIFTIKPVGSDN